MDDRELFQHFMEIKSELVEVRKEQKILRAEIEHIIDTMEQPEEEPKDRDTLVSDRVSRMIHHPKVPESDDKQKIKISKKNE